jgi:membrane protein
VLIAVLFAAIYKVLPDRPIAWRDVIIGGIATALLFTIGKTLIGLWGAARSHRVLAPPAPSPWS